MHHRRVGILAALAPSLALAAGTDIPEQGAVGAARGGAFTADASDVSAIFYNPAGLSQHAGFSFGLDVSLLDHKVSFFRRNADGSAGSKDQVAAENRAGFFFLPMAALSYGLPVAGRTLTFALGAHGPSAVGRYHFPAPDYTCAEEDTLNKLCKRYEDDPRRKAFSRYTLIDNDLLILYPTLSASMMVLPPSDERPVWIAVGASLHYVVSQMAFRQILFDGLSLGYPDNCQVVETEQGPVNKCGPATMREEDPNYDTVASIDVSGKTTFTGSFGALVGVGKKVQVGAYFRPGFKLELDGKLELEMSKFATEVAKAQVSGNAVTLELNLPTIARLGVLFRPIPALAIELDGVYEGWGEFKEIVLTPRDVKFTIGTTTQDVAPLHIKKNFRDAFSARLGAEYGHTLGVPLKFRAGFIYETAAVPMEQSSVDFAHFDRMFVSAGAGATFGRINVDLAFAYGLPVRRTVTDSQVVMGVSQSDTLPAVVGRGDYDSSVLHIAVGVHGHIGG